MRKDRLRNRSGAEKELMFREGLKNQPEYVKRLLKAYGVRDGDILTVKVRDMVLAKLWCAQKRLEADFKGRVISRRLVWIK